MLTYYIFSLNPVEEKKEMTLDDLAAMMAKGFEDVLNRSATKDDIAALRTEMEAMKLEL
jgi:hypothetical protein